MSRLRKLAAEDIDGYFKGLGFSVVDTGGNCQAYEYRRPNGSYIWITDDSGISLPKSNDGGLIVSYYDENDVEEGTFNYSNLDKLKLDLPSVMKQ